MELTLPADLQTGQHMIEVSGHTGAFTVREPKTVPEIWEPIACR